MPGDVHKTHFAVQSLVSDWHPDGDNVRFHHHVVASSTTTRPILAVACDTRIYQTWVDLSQCLIVHAVFLESAGEIVLNQYIALFGKSMKNIFPGRTLEVKANGFLVAVDLEPSEYVINDKQGGSIRLESRRSHQDPPFHFAPCK